MEWGWVGLGLGWPLTTFSFLCPQIIKMICILFFNFF